MHILNPVFLKGLALLSTQVMKLRVTVWILRLTSVSYYGGGWYHVRSIETRMHLIIDLVTGYVWVGLL